MLLFVLRIVGFRRIDSRHGNQVRWRSSEGLRSDCRHHRHGHRSVATGGQSAADEGLYSRCLGVVRDISAWKLPAIQAIVD